MVGPLLRSSLKMSPCSIVTSRSTPCLHTLASESLTRSGSMSKPRALQAYSLAAVTGMRPSPQPRSQITSLLVTLASRSSASTTFCGVGSSSTSAMGRLPGSRRSIDSKSPDERRSGVRQFAARPRRE